MLLTTSVVSAHRPPPALRTEDHGFKGPRVVLLGATTNDMAKIAGVSCPRPFLRPEPGPRSMIYFRVGNGLLRKGHTGYAWGTSVGIVISKLLKRYSKAKRTTAPAYSRALRRIKGGFSKGGVKRSSGPISRIPGGHKVAVKVGVVQLEKDRMRTHPASSPEPWSESMSRRRTGKLAVCKPGTGGCQTSRSALESAKTGTRDDHAPADLKAATTVSLHMVVEVA